MGAAERTTARLDGARAADGAKARDNGAQAASAI